MMFAVSQNMARIAVFEGAVITCRSEPQRMCAGKILSDGYVYTIHDAEDHYQTYARYPTDEQAKEAMFKLVQAINRDERVFMFPPAQDEATE